MPEQNYYRSRLSRGQRALSIFIQEEDIRKIRQASAVEGFATVAAWARKVLSDRAEEILKKQED